MEREPHFCPGCGSSVGAGDVFCAGCGSPVLPAPGGGRPSSRAWLWLAGGLLASMIIAVSVVAILTFGDSGPQVAPRTTADQGLSDPGEEDHESSSTTADEASTNSEAPVPTSTTAPAIATTRPSTTTTAAPTTTTSALTPPPGYYQPDLWAAAPPSLPGSDGASGSGCMAGSDPLWDGVWFGYVEGRRANGVVFNLACFYHGPIAAIEGAKDGIVVGGDVYIRNAVSLTWDLEFHPQAVAYVADPAAPIGFSTIPFALWPDPGWTSLPCPGQSCGVWLYLNQGIITAVVEYPG